MAKIHDEKVIIQTGYSTYEPKYCEWKKLYSYKEMSENIAKARIVITHGGPSSFIAPLQIGKIPIVVPRKKVFNEHVNDHQVNFIKKMAERIGTILVVYDIENLGKMIDEYSNLILSKSSSIKNNNEGFCLKLEKLVNELIGEKE